MKTNPAWYYDEKQIGVNYLDTEIVGDYDEEHQKFRNFREEADDIVHKLEIKPSDVVVDFGCGTGGIALNLAPHCKRVICVDISQKMLNVLETKAREQKIGNIETICAGFLSYSHEGGPVDKIVSKVALHHLPDFWKSIALLKMAKILKTRGKLFYFDVVFTFDPPEHENVINKMVETMRHMAGDSMAEEAMIHIKDEFSTYGWIMDGLFEKTGFCIDSKTIKAENYVTYICSKI